MTVYASLMAFQAYRNPNSDPVIPFCFLSFILSCPSCESGLLAQAAWDEPTPSSFARARHAPLCRLV
jgi:hypothetical protein